MSQNKSIADSIRVQPTTVWRMQRPDGSYCMEWDGFEERQAREYYAERNAQNPDHAAQYEIKSVQTLSEHAQNCNKAADEIERLIAALAAQAGQREPLFWRYKNSDSTIPAMQGYTPGPDWTPLYAPPAPVRQPLTNQVIDDCVGTLGIAENSVLVGPHEIRKFARAIEAKINEKGGV